MKTKKIFLFAVVVVFICTVFSCASSSSSKREPDVSEYTPENEYYIGRSVAVEILKRYDILDYNGNNVLIDYLNNICAAITINSPRPDIFNGYRVAVLDSDQINAFATPGGHVFVTIGLINAAKSEDALAGVIAHEIAHIQLQHGLKAIAAAERDGKIASVSGQVLNLGLGIWGALDKTGRSVQQGAQQVSSALGFEDLTDLFSKVIEIFIENLITKGYSREQELDADRNAMALMTAAGYNPSGLLDTLNELAAVQGRVSGGFNSTHPTPAQRINSAQNYIGRFTVEDTSEYRQERFTWATM